MRVTTLVDVHVHFHRCFRLAGIVESVWRHLERARATSGAEATFACLVSAEIGAGDPIEFVRSGIPGLPPPWSATQPRETSSRILRRNGSPAIAVVPGRQIATCEGLEVLAVGTTSRIAPGAPLHDTIASIRDRGGVPVLPWGFGKWLFRRGRRLDAVLAEARGGEALFLGDSGCRPQGWGTPKQLAREVSRGLPVLAGSDPLPFRDHEGRVGSYGSLLHAEVNWDRPAAWLRAQLSALVTPPEIVGCGRRFSQFVHDQLRLRQRSEAP